MSGHGGFALPETAGIGRMCLRVGSIDRVAGFYRDAVGLTVSRDAHVAHLSAGDEPLVLLREDDDAPERPPDAAGLFHLAVRVPDRAALAGALGRLQDSGGLSGASDHLVSEALYTRDPEGNGVEVYCDRPREEWPDENDGVRMETLPLDLDDLAAAASHEHGLPPGTDIGHVHLEVTDLSRSEAFYTDDLGLRVRARYGGAATFLAAGDYHHHVGLNVWNGRSAPAGTSRGVAWFEFALPGPDALDRVRHHLHDRTVHVEEDDETLRLSDPDGIGVRFCV